MLFEVELWDPNLKDMASLSHGKLALGQEPVELHKTLTVPAPKSLKRGLGFRDLDLKLGA